MFDYYITFRSITRAQRGSRLLDSIGLHHQLLRTPKVLSAQGCGYALRLRQELGAQAVEALRQNEIGFQRVYQLDGGGQYQEIGL
ncbi:MAG: DUF3343 domain-containing protein [Oscillospiraceae bacterium]|nr:DUF3343 domain-containing protein [Oscillospiraceae bacterium]